MAFLGDSGALTLQRELAAPGVLEVSNFSVSGNSVVFLDNAYMTGDQVLLSLSGGLPIAGAGPSNMFWIHRDNLDRISFHNSPQDALNNKNRAVFNSDSWADISISQIQQPSKLVADIREWKLDLDCSVIDTTPIGVKFGENICDLVTGTGSFEFLVEMRNDDAIMNAIDLLNLLLLTGPGSKAYAQFWMHKNKPGSTCSGLLPGAIYYEANILIVSSSVQLRPDEIVEGVVTFATTEDVHFRIDSTP